MKTKSFALFIVLSVMMLLLSCGKSTKGGNDNGKVAVTVTSQRLNDSSAFTMSNGERCSITAEATIDYPTGAGEGVAIDSLQRLFAAYVLESGDTLSLQEAMRQVVANSMHQYDFMAEPAGDEAVEVAESDDLTTLKYATSTRVSPVYNKNGVVTFERVDVVKKNDKVTSVTHRYYSFDVEKQTFIDVCNLFRDDAVADVCQLLRTQLLKQNNATGNEQLNDLGYFNVENITVTRNFYFDENGVTWSYLPNELAVEAVGEPKITIPYSELKDMQCDDSILEKF
ncbi:MAG: RsiV family protein [Bacteroidales bacterium]|nr:RsiV family protein [Bacteroidales bacterium]